MITAYLNLPIGGMHGWGICGKHLALEMSRLGSVKLLTAPFDARAVGNNAEYDQLTALLPPAGEPPQVHEFPLLQGIRGADLIPIAPDLRGRRTVGYTFFEETRLNQNAVEQARRHFDVIAAGSSWCARVLEEHGLTNVKTVLQGIDPTLFYPRAPERRMFPDRFVIFSGGKFELRKGHDLVIRAVKAMQDRHRDVMLVTSWHNPWKASFATMQASDLIRFSPTSGTFPAALNEVLADNGLDVSRVVHVPPRANAEMAEVYRQTDVGLFPNRCEGGTNLVLMEYMACGKPVIATATTGHADVVNDKNALVVGCPATRQVASADRRPIAEWPEPDLGQIIDQLEEGYRNRDRLSALGARAGNEISLLTWKRAAQAFWDLLGENSDYNPDAFASVAKT